MKLTTIRHGETIENKEKILMGHLPGKLSKLGIEQAKKLALRLKNEKFDVIYSSDLKRAVDTAKEIIKYHKNTPIYYVEELRERDLGSYQGKKRGTVDWDNLPEDVETLGDMKKRIKKFLLKVYNKYSKSSVLFITHAGITRSLMSIIDKKIEAFLETEKPKNAAIFVFEIKGGLKGEIIIENCIEHL